MTSAFGVESAEQVVVKLWEPGKHKRDRAGKFATLDELEAKKLIAYNKQIQPVGRLPGKMRVRDLSEQDQAERKRRQQLHNQKTQQRVLINVSVFGGAMVAAPFLLHGHSYFTAKALSTAAPGAMRAAPGYSRAARAPTGAALAKVNAAMRGPQSAKALAHAFATMKDADSKAISHWFAPNGVTQGTIVSARSASPNEKARLVSQLLAHADPKDTPELVRGMHGVRAHQTGDVVDFGPMASFTSDFSVAHDWVKNSMASVNQVHAVYLLEKGTVPALRVDQSMRMNPMHEWLVGGRFEITAGHTLPSFATGSKAPVKLYTIKPYTPPAPAPVTKRRSQPSRKESAVTVSAFGVEHVSKKANEDDSERAKHYGRMSGNMAVLGGAAGTVGLGSGIVGQAEQRGHDPMGFTERPGGKKLTPVGRARVLKPFAAAHAYQAKTLGGLAGGSLALAGAYKLKQRKEQLGKSVAGRTRRRQAGDVGLGAASAGVGGATLAFGMKNSHMLNQQANLAAGEVRAAHHLIAGTKANGWNTSAADLAGAKRERAVGLRVLSVKKPAAVLAAGAAAAGGASLLELGRRAASRPGKQSKEAAVAKSAFGIGHEVISKFGAPAAAAALGAPAADVKNKKVLVGQNAPAMVTASAPGGVNKVKAKLAPLTQTPTVS